MMKERLVTTIIPVYNRPDQLIEAVESVLAQTYRPIEIIIIDDGSTDCTLETANELSEKYDSIKVIHQENGGPGAAREAGRQLAQGEFIQYLDSDDVLLPDKFMIQVLGLNENIACDVSYGMTRYRHADGSIEPGAWKGSGKNIKDMFPSFLQSRWWDTPNPLYRKSVCDRAGAWSNLRLEEDWEYDCRIASLDTKLHFVNDFVCEVRDHDDNRLCRGEANEPARMRQRAKAHQMIYGHARNAGITPDTEEMKHFSRELFLLSRQCGGVGLAEESKMLFNLSLEASTPEQRSNLQYKLYEFGANLIGWEKMGKLSGRIDNLRK